MIQRRDVEQNWFTWYTSSSWWDCDWILTDFCSQFKKVNQKKKVSPKKVCFSPKNKQCFRMTKSAKKKYQSGRLQKAVNLICFQLRCNLMFITCIDVTLLEAIKNANFLCFQRAEQKSPRCKIFKNRHAYSRSTLQNRLFINEKVCFEYFHSKNVCTVSKSLTISEYKNYYRRRGWYFVVC